MFKCRQGDQANANLKGSLYLQLGIIWRPGAHKGGIKRDVCKL